MKTFSTSVFQKSVSDKQIPEWRKEMNNFSKSLKNCKIRWEKIFSSQFDIKKWLFVFLLIFIDFQRKSSTLKKLMDKLAKPITQVDSWN